MQVPVPLILLVLTSMVVTVWMHVVGHSTLASAQSSHIAPIMMLSSIVILAGVAGFFLCNVVLSLLCSTCYAMYSFVCRRKNAAACAGSPYEYYREDHSLDSSMDHTSTFHGEFTIEDGTPMEDMKEKEEKKIEEKKEEYEEEEDMDEYAYVSSGLVDYSIAYHNNKGSDKQLLPGDILTVTMVWTNVYGLGLAFFLLMPIVTMGSTLAVYNFILGLDLVVVYETIQERRDPMYRYKQWRAGLLGARIRNGLHMAALLIANVVIILMGTHVSSIHINKVGQIKVEDVFLGVIAPLLTPFLLKAVRRPHTTIVGTMELAMPFCAFLALTFMISVLAMGMKPFEVKEQLSRNMVAATILLPLFYGGVIMYMLHCILRRRMLYVLCSFLTVFVGRQFTFSKQQPVVSSSFVLSSITFLIVITTSSNTIMKIVSRN